MWKSESLNTTMTLSEEIMSVKLHTSAPTFFYNTSIGPGQGTSLRVIKEKLGHSSSRTTEIYSK